MMTAINNCIFFKLINYSWGHNQVLFYSIWDVQHFPETHDVTNVLSDPLTEKQQLSSQVFVLYTRISTQDWKHHVFLSQDFCVVFDCEMGSLWFRSWLD